MTTIEIFWQDLTSEKQQEILSITGDNGNWDVFPLATIDLEDDADIDADIPDEDDEDLQQEL